MSNRRESDTIAKRVPSLAFAIDEKPPHTVLIAMAFQHLIILSSYLVLPILVVAATGVSGATAIEYVRMSLIVIGIATLLQCLTRGPIGSGYGVPQLPAPIFFGASIIAAHKGGLGLISGMTLFAGLLMVGISRGIDRMRALLPPEVIGVIVLMVGISLLPSSLREMLAVPEGLAGVTQFQVITVSVLSFGTMVVITAGNSRFQRLGLLIGVTVGTLLSLALGIVPMNSSTLLSAAHWLALPLPLSLPPLDFDWTLVPAFAVAALASCTKSVGDLTIFQKANDDSWVRPDMAPLSRGVLASRLGTCIAGLIGSMGTGTSTACIGLSIATRTMSRVIAVLVGVLAIVLGCIPVLAALFVLIPDPVKGAMVLFVVCFLMVSGFQLITSRMLDTRRTFVVGASLAAGLGVYLAPDLYHGLVPQALESGLTMTALLALILNLLSRLGVTVSAALEIPVGPAAGRKVAKEMELLGGKWGARRDVIARVIGALTELTEILALRDAKTVHIDLKFDEFSITAKARFDGPPLDLPANRPTDAVLLENDPSLFPSLAGYLIRAFCTKVEQQTAQGKTVLDMRFQH
ncbi:MAG: purine/pyrimidine permease [Deltaproteobacteria bacterium]|nr:purine/pyrimidine permease [Deltaproteobacteria bacterium]